jgi:hypothetical protein
MLDLSVSASVRAIAKETGIALSIEVDGSFEVTSRISAWQFSGNVGSPVSNVASRHGRAWVKTGNTKPLSG